MRALYLYMGTAASAGAYKSWNKHHGALNNMDMNTTEQLALTSQLFAQGVFSVSKGGASAGIGAFLLAGMILFNFGFAFCQETQANKRAMWGLWGAAHVAGVPLTAAALGYGGFTMGEGAMDIFQSLQKNASSGRRF